MQIGRYFVDILHPKKKLAYSRKLSEEQVRDIQSHFESDDISFPLPEKKYQRK